MVHKSTSNFVTIAFYSPALTYTLSTRMLLKLALPPAPSAGKPLSYLKHQTFHYNTHLSLLIIAGILHHHLHVKSYP